jgi:hypothetical protein
MRLTGTINHNIEKLPLNMIPHAHVVIVIFTPIWHRTKLAGDVDRGKETILMI